MYVRRNLNMEKNEEVDLYYLENCSILSNMIQIHINTPNDYFAAKNEMKFILTVFLFN